MICSARSSQDDLVGPRPARALERGDEVLEGLVQILDPFPRPAAGVVIVAVADALHLEIDRVEQPPDFEHAQPGRHLIRMPRPGAPRAARSLVMCSGSFLTASLRAMYPQALGVWVRLARVLVSRSSRLRATGGIYWWARRQVV